MSETNPHRGSSLHEFLKEEGVLEETEARALKRAIALQVTDLMRRKAVSKTGLSSRMRTSRAALNRLLDASNTSVTLRTLNQAALALGRRLKIEFVRA